MNIKILGTGCPSCQKVEALARQAAEEMNLQPTFEKITKINEIVEYGIARTPGLVINEKVVSSGKIPTVEQIKTWIQEAE